MGSPVLRRFFSLAELDAQAAALLSRPSLREDHGAGCDIAGDRARLRRPRLLIEGWAARARSLPDGRRQILSFILPGDSIDLAVRPHPLATGTVTALTRARTAEAGELEAAIRTGTCPSLAEAFRISDCLAEAYLLNQVLRLGRLTAYERICHLFLELHERLGMVGIGAANRFPLPLTQEVLADATALSTVHVNRTLQQLRRDELLDLRSGHAILPDLDRLRAVCDYEPQSPHRWA